MIDYKVAFHEGQDAAKEAENARKEIDSVFDKLNREIAEVSSGKIVIERRKFKEPATMQSTLRDLATMLQRGTYSAIAASNPTIPDGPVKELARWSIDRRGYPCRISWGGQEHFCEDKEALERGFAELLRDPLVGEKLYVLTKLEPPEYVLPKLEPPSEEEINDSAQQDAEPDSDPEG